jgi:hypothetical protein|tara:strand:- start:5580 stop:6125 length:546 start_codon:yes stop_codon:yes gene_type:complete
MRSINDPTPDEWDSVRAIINAKVPEPKWTRLDRKDQPEVGTREWYQDKSPFKEGFYKGGRKVAKFDGSGNPKARVGSLKAPLHLVPPALSIGVAYALKDGAAKYGAYNWRSEEINVSTYVGAMLRHLYAYQDGEDDAQDSGLNHVAHVASCCALLMDSKAHGNLVDDRSTGPAASVLKEML